MLERGVPFLPLDVRLHEDERRRVDRPSAACRPPGCDRRADDLHARRTRDRGRRRRRRFVGHVGAPRLVELTRSAIEASVVGSTASLGVGIGDPWISCLTPAPHRWVARAAARRAPRGACHRHRRVRPRCGRGRPSAGRTCLAGPHAGRTTLGPRRGPDAGRAAPRGRCGAGTGAPDPRRTRRCAGGADLRPHRILRRRGLRRRALRRHECSDRRPRPDRAPRTHDHGGLPQRCRRHRRGVRRPGMAAHRRRGLDRRWRPGPRAQAGSTMRSAPAQKPSGPTRSSARWPTIRRSATWRSPAVRIRSGARQVVAFVVPASIDAPPDVAEVRTFLADRLAPFKAPA